jgi:uncharacterized cupredoxin-like copper-binding protein
VFYRDTGGIFMMKKFCAILALSVLAASTWAAGVHSNGHEPPADSMSGHDMVTVPAAPAAMGHPGDPTKVTRTIEVVMDDSMRFTPNEIPVKAGETIRFSVRNTGQVTHEMVIGTMAELKAHAAEMQRMPGMVHADPNMVTVAPGTIGTLVWLFDQPGTVNFACMVPGHMEAGMIGKMKVD